MKFLAVLDVAGFKHHKITMEKSFYLMCLKAAIFSLLISPYAFAEKLYLFDIPKQPADKALIAFSKTIEQTVLFSYEKTKDFQLNEIKGYYSIDQALIKLLRNTGLQAQYLDNHLSVSINAQEEKQKLNLIQDKQPTKIAEINNEAQIEKIAIVGTRELGRVLQDLPVPVDIFSSLNLKDTGQFELGRMLQTIAPSFNFPSSSISDGTDVIKPATLRGLGPDQTLILVNGKRRHHASLLHINTSVGRGTAGADLNAIPLTAIKRVEILRDGAAAQYGSDAIAGVINIVLKDSDHGGSVDTSMGQYSKGDGDTANLSINKGFSLFQKGYFNATFDFIDHESTNRAGLHGTCQFYGCETLSNGDFLTNNPREISADRTTFNVGDPSYQQLSFSYNSSFPLASGEIYSFALYSDRENDAATFFRHNAYELANPYLQDQDAVRPNGYLPLLHSDIKDTSFNIGFKTSLDDMTFDVSFTQGQNQIDYQTQNSLNASYVSYLNYAGELTPNEIREQIPTSAKAYRLLLGLKTLNIDLQKTFENLSFSFGLELREDKYEINAGDKYSYFNYTDEISDPLFTGVGLGGIQGFPGISPKDNVNESRDITSIYFEINNHWENITLDSAIRYDNYEDIGDTSNIKIAANWQPNETITLRGSFSTGFRAPSMQQLYFNNISTQFLVDENSQFTAEQIGTFRNDSKLAKLIGVPSLKEEQSTNLSLGTIINFNDSMSLSLDYYAIEIKDRIVISNTLCPEYSPELATILANHHVDKAQVFLNGADTYTNGIDLIATWKTHAYNGLLDITLAGNYTDTDVDALYTPNDIISALSIEQVFAEQDISIIEEWQPKSRISLSSQYQQDDWSLNLTFNHFGSYTITDGDTQKYGKELLTDLKLNAKITPKMSWYLGINNVFNVMPDKNEIGNSHAGRIIDNNGNEIVNSTGVFKYSRRSAPFGFNGTYYYAGLNYKF